MSKEKKSSVNPRRSTATKVKRSKRKGLTVAGRRKLQKTARRNQPWRHSTGPRTIEGKRRSSQNSRLKDAVRHDREIVQSVTREVNELLATLAACRAAAQTGQF